MSWRDAVESSELRLILHCARWPRTPARVAAIRACADAVTEWGRVVRLANQHRVVGLVGDALKAAGVVMAPPAAEALVAATARSERRSRRQLLETIRLQQAFPRAGLRALILKGVPLALLAYGSLDRRFSSDIDLLVAEEDAEPAWRLLESLGYSAWLKEVGALPPERRPTRAQFQALVRHHKEMTFYNSTVRAHVELHWQACDFPALLRGVDARSPTREVDVAGTVPVSVLLDDDMLAYLCVHGALHRWSRLQWIADVDALLAPRSDEAIVALWEHTDRLGARRCVEQALIVRSRLFEAPVPAAIAGTLRDDQHALADYVMTLAFTGEDDGASSLGSMLRDIRVARALTGAWSDLAPMLGQHFYCTRDLLSLPLPASMQWLYPVLRLPLLIGRRVTAGRDAP